jgi:hypothetical protein
MIETLIDDNTNKSWLSTCPSVPACASQQIWARLRINAGKAFYRANWDEFLKCGHLSQWLCKAEPRTQICGRSRTYILSPPASFLGRFYPHLIYYRTANMPREESLSLHSTLSAADIFRLRRKKEGERGGAYGKRHDDWADEIWRNSEVGTNRMDSQEIGKCGFALGMWFYRYAMIPSLKWDEWWED